MHLLIVGLNFAPELTGVGKYTGEMASWYCQRGYRVSVVTAPPYYPSWKKGSNYRRWAWQLENWQGINVIRCPIYVPHHLSGLHRYLHLCTFALSSALPVFFRALRGRPDLVLAVAPTLLAAPIALAAARLVHSRTWLHVQDMEIEAAFRLGIIRNRLFAHAILATERGLLRQFDLVSSVSAKMVDSIERKGVAKERLFLLPNWVNTRSVFPLRSPTKLRRELGIAEDRCVALYAGSMGLKQGLDVIIEAAQESARLPAASPVFVLSGDGPARPRLMAQARGLPNVVFLPLQPEERFNELINAADVALLPQEPGAADLVMPSKLGAIFAAGKPVVATVLQDSGIAAAVGNAGVIVPPGDPRSLAAAVSELAANPERRERMGIAARALGMELDTERIMERAEARVLELCGPRAARRLA